MGGFSYKYRSANQESEAEVGKEYRNLIVVFKGGPDDKCIVSHQEANDALDISEDGPLPNVGDVIARFPLFWTRSIASVGHDRALEAWGKVGARGFSHASYRVESIADEVMVCAYVGG